MRRNRLTSTGEWSRPAGMLDDDLPVPLDSPDLGDVGGRIDRRPVGFCVSRILTVANRDPGADALDDMIDPVLIEGSSGYREGTGTNGHHPVRTSGSTSAGLDSPFAGSGHPPGDLVRALRGLSRRDDHRRQETL